MKKQAVLVPEKIIENRILLIRGKKVMLDRDLADLYRVSTKVLNQAVRRNIYRFPPDFMFTLNEKEFSILRSQIVTSSWGGQRYLPYAFTEQGVAMLSSVLNSRQAIMVNIQIMRTFTKLRQIMLTHRDLQRKIEEIILRQETKFKTYDEQIQYIFKVINEILNPVVPEPPKKKYGFLADREN
ncbi:DNA-binding protein [Candidatus Termititenax aidoneus]|uniref:DNA-binding protein n=1 Tax=Termititenax aidoneus TaxID=2218524 RepID=A0A388TAQ0_TERA1|nr:DNA-binding protein [Candidatus Termititenax aidoneus]GBR73813.1 DNA-binding protein [Candidatus Termititenax aidoneus]